MLPLATLAAADSAGASARSKPAGAYTCRGPSIPAGTYSTVTVTGTCQVNDGFVVTGGITIQAGAALVAAFGRNDVSGHGASGLTDYGNVNIGSNGTLVLGCEPTAFPCFDDPNPKKPTLVVNGIVGGSIIATAPLGVIVHATQIGYDVLQTGGGGGITCKPVGVFKAFGSPAYSDYEDNTIGGNLSITGLRTCWLGAIRDGVGGSLDVLHNTSADPDATEILTDRVAGNLICAGNSPAEQYGDSHGSANVVSGAAVGECGFGVLAHDPEPTGPLRHVSLPSGQGPRYTLGAADGGVFNFGTAFYGSAAGTAELFPYVGVAAAPGGQGYWLADGAGRVPQGPELSGHAFGPNAAFFGDASGHVLARPVVGIAASPRGDGYWLVAADGGVFNYGPGAAFYGSAGRLHLSTAIVGIAAAPAGDGYYLAGRDGGVFCFGAGTRFDGSAAGKSKQPIVGIAVDPSTGGYWVVSAGGSVFSFGAPNFGSASGLSLSKPIVAIAAVPGGGGYYLVGRDGGVFAFGPGARFRGSMGNRHLNKPIDAVAAA
jgi:hypothetical protein